ncbi:uncharacterized protein ColSpa_10905 [Colletotrichum spaethianum]|uniref:Uncharacterized protein n=1 Tax=Colletotrichum spaethianum TaxID=700344 RepID=A0AA37PEH5_9PEZI|nr:uncharacterized protein ColSpa_10905 [Colletotrichum spaethianum]GKT50724.1 hypothetical protein ColSpa_10905 [Colletotrichum spaethianum]
MRLVPFVLLSTLLASAVSSLALPWLSINIATSQPPADFGDEERRNSKFPKEMDLMEELMRRAERYCPGAHGEDKNECYWKLRGAWPGCPNDYPPSLSLSKSNRGALDRGDG